MPGELIIRWTARLFVACYVGRLAIDATSDRSEAAQQIARWLWTIGCVIFFIHVAAAFHWLHHWSHAEAYEHVRIRTIEMTGFPSGVGIYVNYAFAVLWLADTNLWWHDLRWSERSIAYYSVQAIFAFLMIQATAIFGPTFWIPIAVGVIALLIVLRRFVAKSAIVAGSSLTSDPTPSIESE